MLEYLSVEKINPNAKLPTRSYPTDAGLDLYAHENISLPAQTRKAVGTGIKIDIPENYVGLVWDKSGLSKNNGLHTLAGVIDAGYHGEIIITLINLSEENYEIKAGQKIAQLLIQPIETPKIKEEKITKQSERESAGFGSTGLM